MSTEQIEQRDAGTSALRFAAPLEDEFRAKRLAALPGTMQVSLWLAVLLIGVAAALDWRTAPMDFAVPAVAVRLGMVLPAVLAALLTTYPGFLLRRVGAMRNVVVAVWSAGMAYLAWLAQGTGLESRVVTETAAVTLFIYLLLGLRTLPAMAWGGVVLVAALLFCADAADALASHATVVLTFVNLVGALTCFRIERAERTAFLEHEVVHLVAGTDSVTGIPSRHIFTTHLHRVWRQALRESRSVAVMIVEVDFFEAFKARYGQLVADRALRRVAHAVMSCARRPLDRAARFSDARISLALYDAEPEFLETAANRVRSQVALLNIPNDVPEAKGQLTVSIGVAAMHAHEGIAENELVHGATEALDGAEPGRHRLYVKQETDDSATAILRGPWQSVPMA